MKKIKILCLLNSLDKCNGISTYIMNYYSRINHDYFEFDFYITDDNILDEYKNCISKNNDRIFIGKRIKLNTFINEKKNFKKILEEEKYDIVYSNILYTAFFYFIEAKKMGVKHRILHSHNTPSKSLCGIKNILYEVSKKLAVMSSNIYFACSDYAGKYLFNKRHYYIIHNAVDTKLYKYNKEIREKYRKKLNIKDEYCIVHIGRFNEQKNHKYIVEISKEIVRFEKNVKIFFIGYGELEEETRKKVEKYGLDDKIVFLGIRNDITSILQAMDVFILPSLYEGLPLVSIEAQAAGLPNILSSKITREVEITQNVKFIDIEEKNIDEWCKNILKYKMFERENLENEVSKSGYNIEEEVCKFEKILLEVVNR